MAINPIDHPLMFQVPELEAPSEWIEHVPFGMLLVDLIRPRTIVELGTYAGVSYCAFCQAVKQLQTTTTCYAVDSWRGDEHGGHFGDEILNTLKQHHDPRYGAFSQLIQSTFDDAVSMFADGSIDFLHIDGFHTYEAVSHDFATWLPKMTQRGIVAFHDIAERRPGFGVWRFWEELAQRYPSFEFHHGHGLGIVCVGSQIPEGFQQLLDCTDEQRDALRVLCYERGSQLRVAQNKATQMQESVARTQESVAAVQENMAAVKAYIEQSEREKRGLLIAKYERTVELLKLREQQVVERERRNRASYETQILSLEERARQLMAKWNDVAWVESSRGVRAIKLARAARYVLRQRGLFYAIGRVLMWFSGKRGVGVSTSTRKPARARRISQPASVAASTTSSVNAQIRDQWLPTDRRFSGVSIVIPVFNALEYAQRCVSSIYEAESQVPFELVIVDNGSDPDVLAWLRSESRRRQNLWYISVSTNMGYARGINLGIEQARGQYLMLSNSDILATPHWLDSLVAVMETHQDIGVLSPLTNYVGHGPQIDPLAVHLQPEDCIEYAETIRANTEVQVVTNALIFFCVMVRRQVASLLGGLDEGYALGNYEDDDFCMRARMAGYKLAIAKNAFVYHFGTKTFTTNKIDHSAFMHRNLLRYLDMLSSMSTSISPRTPRRNVTEPLISVVVRTVDRPQALTLALTSLANQTLDNFEVVVVCDAGPDIQQLLEAFSPYLSVRYVRNAEPQGRSQALNTGVAHATGKYITYLDDDDVVYPTHLETLLDTVKEGDEGTVFAYVDYNRALMTSLEGGLATISRVPIGTWTFSYDQLLAQNYLPMHTWLHDRALWEEVGGFDTHMDMLEDWDFLIRAAQRRDFVAAKRITCEYRFYLAGSNSLVTNRPRTLEATQKIYQRYPANAQTEVERASHLLALREQIAEGSRILASVGATGEAPEPVMRQLLADLAGFVQ